MSEINVTNLEPADMDYKQVALICRILCFIIMYSNMEMSKCKGGRELWSTF